MSPPAQKARSPAPRMTTRAISSSLSQSLSVCDSARIISKSNALRAEVRFNVIMPACPALLTSTFSLIFFSSTFFLEAVLHLDRHHRTKQHRPSALHQPKGAQHGPLIGRPMLQKGGPLQLLSHVH